MPCVFCPGNGQVRILWETEGAYLIAVIGLDGVEMEGRYLIIPRTHIESVLHLPENWQGDVAKLIRKVPEFVAGLPYNISYNEGRDAGQRIPHTHAWLIFRRGEEGKPSFQLGLNALLAI